MTEGRFHTCLGVGKPAAWHGRDLEASVAAACGFQPCDSAIKEIAEFAYQANESSENIGARRLHTLLEMILRDIAFNAGGGDAPSVEVAVDDEYVKRMLSSDIRSKDVRKYIL